MPKKEIKLDKNQTYYRVVPFRAEMNDDDMKQGIIKGTLTTYGNSDCYGDVMADGCFDEWAKENDSCPMLWTHRAADVIGKWGEFVSDSEGFKATGKLVKGIQRADELVRLYDEDLVTGVSVGFNLRGSDSYEYIYDEEDKYVIGYKFTNLNLREASPCLWPANEMAQITEVKNENGVIDYRALERIVYKTTNLSKRESCDIFSQIRASGDPRQPESGDPLKEEQRILRALLKLDWRLSSA